MNGRRRRRLRTVATREPQDGPQFVYYIIKWVGVRGNHRTARMYLREKLKFGGEKIRHTARRGRSPPRENNIDLLCL